MAHFICSECKTRKEQHISEETLKQDGLPECCGKEMELDIDLQVASISPETRRYIAKAEERRKKKAGD